MNYSYQSCSTVVVFGYPFLFNAALLWYKAQHSRNCGGATVSTTFPTRTLSHHDKGITRKIQLHTAMIHSTFAAFEASNDGGRKSKNAVNFVPRAPTLVSKLTFVSFLHFSRVKNSARLRVKVFAKRTTCCIINN